MIFLAGEAPTQTLLSPWIQLGAVGVIVPVLAWAFWKLLSAERERANSVIAREQERGDRLEKELSEKNVELQDTVKQVFPTILQMTDLVKVMVDKNAQMQSIIDYYQRQRNR